MTEPRGTNVRPAHFPDRAPIDAYGNGGFKFANMAHRGGLLCLPSGIHGWTAGTLEDCDDAAFQPVFDEAGSIEIFLFGTGRDLVPIGDTLRARFRAHAIMADPMGTGAAVRTYNVLLAEGRAVGAAFLPVE